jgi:hypothetical protein
MSHVLREQFHPVHTCGTLPRKATGFKPHPAKDVPRGRNSVLELPRGCPASWNSPHLRWFCASRSAAREHSTHPPTGEQHCIYCTLFLLAVVAAQGAGPRARPPLGFCSRLYYYLQEQAESPRELYPVPVKERVTGSGQRAEGDGQPPQPQQLRGTLCASGTQAPECAGDQAPCREAGSAWSSARRGRGRPSRRCAPAAPRPAAWAGRPRATWGPLPQ